MSDDISDTIQPKSDQLDAVDLLAGPRTFTIERVDVRKADEQPVNIHLAGFPRPWRPGKSMRRVLIACWGPSTGAYAGRSVRLYADPDVKFGGEKVGGTRISHLSHIDQPKQVPLLISRGKSAIFTVEPLPTAEQVAASTSTDELGAMWKLSGPEMRARVVARVAELRATPADPDGPMVPPSEPEGPDPWAQSGESLLDQTNQPREETR